MFRECVPLWVWHGWRRFCPGPQPTAGQDSGGSFRLHYSVMHEDIHMIDMDVGDQNVGGRKQVAGG